MSGSARVEPGRFAEVDARAAIADLAARYCRGADDRDEALFQSVWHPDAVWDVGAHRFVGHEQILEAVSRQWSMFRSMRHDISNSTVELTGAHRARGRHDVTSLTTLEDGKQILTSGWYDDTYSLRDGSWRIDLRCAVTRSTGRRAGVS